MEISILFLQRRKCMETLSYHKKWTTKCLQKYTQHSPITAFHKRIAQRQLFVLRQPLEKVVCRIFTTSSIKLQFLYKKKDEISLKIRQSCIFWIVLHKFMRKHKSLWPFYIWFWKFNISRYKTVKATIYWAQIKWFEFRGTQELWKRMNSVWFLQYKENDDKSTTGKCLKCILILLLSLETLLLFFCWHECGWSDYAFLKEKEREEREKEIKIFSTHATSIIQ